MLEKSRSFELQEPRSPESLVPDPWLEPWMIAAAVVLLLVLLGLRLFYKKKPQPVDPLAIRRAAHAEAVTALEQIGAVSAREAAVRCSLILRKFLSIAAGDPALFETHEETLARHDALQGFSPPARAAAASGFSKLAALKYAPEIPDVAATEVIAGSRELLETLHLGFQA